MYWKFVKFLCPIVKKSWRKIKEGIEVTESRHDWGKWNKIVNSPTINLSNKYHQNENPIKE